MQNSVPKFPLRIASTITTLAITAMLAACSGGGSNTPPLAQAPVQNNTTTGSTLDSNTVELTPPMVAQSATVSGFHYHIMRVHNVNKPPTTQGKERTQGIIYTDDVVYGGGALLKHTVQHDIFLNCSASCFGGPQTFQADLNLSTWVHVIDQYTHVTTNNRYPVGTAFRLNETFYHDPLNPGTNPTVSESDIFNIVHAAAKVSGSGYGHEYHVFLAPGLDQCFDYDGGCYSPDFNPSFVFCAYHGSITFSDIGHVIYSVEPYQLVPGCGNSNGVKHFTGPNPVPLDDTATVLEHETFESISDPDPPTGYYNNTSGEIGDPCDFPNFILRREIETLNGRQFLLQPIYSNAVHACFFE